MLPDPFGFGVGVAKGDTKVKRFAGSLLVVAFASASALGGTVTFTSSNNSFNPFAAGFVVGVDDQVVFDISITDLDGALGTVGDVGEGFDALELLIGSNDGLSFAGPESFVFSPEANALSFNCGLTCVTALGSGAFYANEFKIDFFAGGTFDGSPPVANLAGGGFTVGTLTVDASGLGLGDFDLLVDSVFDQNQSIAALANPFEGISGIGTVHITPEPATISLLGLASLALIRRRKKA